METPNQNNILKTGKRLAKILLWLFLLLGIAVMIGWYILRVDHPFIIEKIENTALEKWNAEIELEGYELEWTQLFSQLKIQVRGLSIATTNENLPPFLKISQANSEVNVWDFKTKNYYAYPFELDSVWIHIYKDSLDNSNLTFRENTNEAENLEKKKSKAFKTKIKELPFVQINYLDFHHQKIAKGKWQKFQLSHAKIQPQVLENGDWTAHLLSDCFFDGLVFQKNKAGFLMNTSGKLDMNLALLDKGKMVTAKNSTLTVDENRYTFDAHFLRADTNELQLKVNTDGVTMKEVMPLLSEKINYVLRDIKVEQPIRANFSMNKKLNSGQKEVIKIDFSSKDTRLVFNGAEMTSATFVGQFNNDCDEDGIGNPATACVTIQQLDGELLGVIPMKLNGEITNLKKPKVDVFGKVKINMPRLNPLLASQDKLTFSNGDATFDFQYQGDLKNLLNSPFEELDIKLKGEATFDDVKIDQDNRYASWPSLSGHMRFSENESSLDDIFLEWMGSNIHISGQLGNLPEYLFYDADALKSDLDLEFDVLNFNQFKSETPNDTNLPKSKLLTSEKLEKLFRDIATNINGKIQLQIDSLIFDDLFATDLNSSFELFTPRRPEFIDSSMIRIDKMTANFMGHTDMSIDLGLSNDSITDVWVSLNLPKTTQTANFFFPKTMEIMDGDASMKLYANVPLRSIFEKEKFISDIQYRGAIDFDQLEMEIDQFDWPVQKISGLMSFNNDQVDFKNLNFEYEYSPFILNGKVNDYPFFNEKKSIKTKVDLNLRGDYFDLRNNNKNNTASQKAIPSPPDLFRSLDTVFHLATGKIDLMIDSILTDENVIDPFLLQAQLVPDLQNPLQHQLVVDSLNFGFGPKNNIKGRAFITNPDDPKIDAHFKTRMQFDQLKKILQSEFIELQKGYFKMDFDYHAPLFDSMTAENYILQAEVDGTAEIVNGEIFYNYRHFDFEDIYAHLRFDEKSIYIRDLDMLVNGNRFISSGESKDFFPFFILPNRKANIELEVTSPYFDLGSFTTPHDIAKNKKAIPFVTADTTESVLSNTATLIDKLLEKGSLEMSTDIKVLAYEKFKADKVKGKISFQPDSVQLNNLKMEIAKGKVSLDGALSGVVLHNPKLELTVKMEQNDIQEIFRQFKDFGQEQFGYKNLKGNASANVQFKADINSNYSILPETMLGDVHLQFNGGELINVKALEDLSGFLFRKRKLEHIHFDSLATTIQIRGNNLYLKKTGLHSSSFDFEVEGVYNWAAFDKTRILLTVPFSNLYRRYITAEAMKSGNSKRKGIPILIEARPKKERLRFRWKLFNSKKNRKRYRVEEGKD